MTLLLLIHLKCNHIKLILKGYYFEIVIENMTCSLRKDFMVLYMITLLYLWNTAVATEGPPHEVGDEHKVSNHSPCLSLLLALLQGKLNKDNLNLENHLNVTEGPNDFLTNFKMPPANDSRPNLIEIMQSSLASLHSTVPNPQPIPIHIKTLANNSPVQVAKDSSEAFSIQISTKIDFGAGAPLLGHVPQGSQLVPIVLNNSLQLNIVETKKPEPKEAPVYQYIDDEDYYLDESSGESEKEVTNEIETTTSTISI